MKVLIAPDSFKGTFTSTQVIAYLTDGFARFFPEAEIIPVPIADGGEGTVEAILKAKKGEYKEVITTGPLGVPVKNGFGVIGSTAIIEMASTSGITLIKEADRDPMHAQTIGTGQLIKHALDEGVEKIIIGVGGSATNDGGVGMARALGVVFYDVNDREVPNGGMGLGQIKRIDTTGLDPRLANVEVVVICDVSNPLCGNEGATYVYGPQKGATSLMLRSLEDGMDNYHRVVKDQFGIELNCIPGSGAAGGLAGGLVAFANGVIKKGIDTMLDIVNFDRLVEDADLVITGEGKLDGQSVYGKVPIGVASRCQGKPVIAFVGAIGDGAERVFDHGISAIFPLVGQVTNFAEIQKHREVMMRTGVERLMRLLKTGMALH